MVLGILRTVLVGQASVYCVWVVSLETCYLQDLLKCQLQQKKQNKKHYCCWADLRCWRSKLTQTKFPFILFVLSFNKGVLLSWCLYNSINFHISLTFTQKRLVNDGSAPSLLHKTRTAVVTLSPTRVVLAVTQKRVGAGVWRVTRVGMAVTNTPASDDDGLDAVVILQGRMGQIHVG